MNEVDTPGWLTRFDFCSCVWSVVKVQNYRILPIRFEDVLSSNRDWVRKGAVTIKCSVIVEYPMIKRKSVQMSLYLTCDSTYSKWKYSESICIVFELSWMITLNFLLPDLNTMRQRHALLKIRCIKESRLYARNAISRYCT